MKIYYYTDVKHAIDDICNEHIKVSQLGKVNDPNEWLPNITDAGGRIKVPVKDSQRWIAEHWGNKYGFVSFAKDWNIAPLWGNYAAHYSGIVFELEVVDEDKILEVKYNDVRPCLSMETSKENFYKALSTKAKAWEYEQEVRFLAQLDDDSCEVKDGLYFAPMGVISPKLRAKISLMRVICGPRIEPSRVIEISQTLDLLWNGKSAIQVVKTGFDQKTYLLLQMP